MQVKSHNDKVQASLKENSATVYAKHYFSNHDMNPKGLNMLTINEIKQIDVEKDDIPATPSVKAVVLSKSQLEKGTGNTKPKFYAVIADETGSISVTIYNDKDYDKFIVGFGVVLINILLKQSYVAVTSRSDVAICKSFAIPDDVTKNAVSLPGQEVPSLKSAMLSPVKTILSVKAKVVKVSPSTTKSFNGTELAFQELALKDNTGSATLSVWDQMVNTCETGQLIRVNKCRVRLFNDVKKLSTTRDSTLEVINHDDTLDDVSSEEEDINGDEPANLELPSGTLVAVFEVDPYLACPRSACNNKKLITVLEKEKYLMQCKNCMSRYRGDNCNLYIRSTMLLKSNHDGDTKKVTIFKPNILKMFESRGVSSTITADKNEMFENLLEIIPFDIKYTLINNTIKEMKATCLLFWMLIRFRRGHP
ncbi:hypothetical protein KUTeg_022001 [Tegillarca granosa]|uniref:Uncharacterized protein n=1 Tax=Tegillarca granosa TaxID=220873 RepID=A0ABQ9E9C5_TEGGR|nr:hypothetical protein KUTeg_022001 [Tegillarca granosa]